MNDISLSFYFYSKMYDEGHFSIVNNDFIAMPAACFRGEFHWTYKREIFNDI